MPRRIRVDPKRGPEFGTAAICQTAPLPGVFVPLSPHHVHMSRVLVVALLGGETGINRIAAPGAAGVAAAIGIEVGRQVD